MKIIRDKRAMALPFVLGIVTFVVGVVATLISYAVFQSRLIAKNIESTETYINAVQSIDATIHIIIREQNLDPTFLSNLATYMDVSITQYNDTVWTISSIDTNIPTVTSYITGDGASISVINDQFFYTGLETSFYQNVLINAHTLLSTFLPQFISTTFPALTPETNFTDLTAIFNYVDSLTQFTHITATQLLNLPNQTVNNHYYVTGNVSLLQNTTLTIPSGYLLFIDGSLTTGTNSTINGNIVVRYGYTSNNKNSTTLRGTHYFGGAVSLRNNVIFGTSTRPSFILSYGTITTGPSLTGYGYLLGSSTKVDSGDDFNLSGGIYPTSNRISPPDSITAYSLSETDLYDYALPITLTDPNATGELTFKFTNPR